MAQPSTWETAYKNINGSYSPDYVADTPTPTVTYKPDGTRAVDTSYADIFKPLDANAYATKQADIKGETTKKIQAYIDSANQAFAPIYAREASAGKSRLGSTALQNALSGQRGAPTGSATTEATNSYNNEQVAAIDAKKQEQINKITAMYQDQEKEDLRYQESLRRSDATQYMNYMQTENDRKEERSKAKINDMISSNISTEHWQPQDLQDYATLYGYTDVNDAKKAIDYKIGANLASTEAARAEQALKDRKTNAEIDKTHSDIIKTQAETEKIANEQKTASQKNMINEGWQYVDTPAKRDALKKQGYDIQKVDGREYAKMNEMTAYSQKKAIDASYAKKSGGSGGGSSATTEKTFWSASKTGVDALKDGEAWGTVWQRMKSQFPNKSADEIDQALGTEWRQAGAFQEWKNKQYKQTDPAKYEQQKDIWAELGSEENANLDNNTKKQWIMSQGFNPEDFGIY